MGGAGGEEALRTGYKASQMGLYGGLAGLKAHDTPLLGEAN